MRRVSLNTAFDAVDERQLLSLVLDFRPGSNASVFRIDTSAVKCVEFKRGTRKLTN